MGADTYADDGYGEGNIFLRFLQHVGWDDLLNVGYFTLPTLPAAVGGGGYFQRALVRRSLALLEAAPGDLVLDAGCGRGHTTARLADAGCRALGVDLSERQIALARARFGHRPRASFAVADVTRLPDEASGTEIADGSFDRVHCLEAAFHFGPKGRDAFLAESHRVLRPGGRLVLVDFTWPDERSARIDRLDPRGLVRAAWQFDDFERLDRYLASAVEAGFEVRAVHDWTRPVVRRSARLIGAVGAVAATSPGRLALRTRWPGLREFTPADWQALCPVIRAHVAAGREVGYTALVLDKRG
ncbi:methyltransferase domain-containing protein [Streptomyces sp. 71268]|uniref:class I SAM-dependent methyltransferase n=1 Tax=Streptomyces sp. 71268 TaxID=3002640 RepID=UPI0023F7E41E|nr:methyltransferase domain-containing protein [Streptomyces sp. 71268]WEV26705.1 methyltransferase domain-containing protein [Streptomyces sp. 71268]